MLKISAPASSANVGPGFDCLGIALNIYNTFEVELSDKTELINVEDRFNNENNLFLQAYRKGCEAIGISDSIKATFDCDIPVSRGLGSSASMILGGLVAASALHDDALSEDQIFQLSAQMEGHPDNVAPALFGGLCAAMSIGDNKFLAKQLDLHRDWKFTVLIPDFEVSTEVARSILPETYPRHEAIATANHAILLTKALADGDSSLLSYAHTDYIHEPYRRQLIHGFDCLRRIVEQDTGGVMFVSGSGSTCLLISKYELTESALGKIAKLEHHWDVRNVQPAKNGTEIRG